MAIPQGRPKVVYVQDSRSTATPSGSTPGSANATNHCLDHWLAFHSRCSICPASYLNWYQIDVSSLPMQTQPTCANNVLTESRTTNFKLANGSVVVVGKTPGITSTVLFDGANTKCSLRANNCGFLVARPSDSLRSARALSSTAPAIPWQAFRLTRCRSVAWRVALRFVATPLPGKEIGMAIADRSQSRQCLQR